jgi:toxin ParE1/3/4
MADRARVVLRARALRDIEDEVDWCRVDAGTDIALGFVAALESALEQVGRNPGIGSPRWASELDLPGLRSWSLDGFPQLVFYVERGGVVDVWRVLHAKRDIPASLQEDDAPGED